jgi:hypothetical protein
VSRPPLLKSFAKDVTPPSDTPDEIPRAQSVASSESQTDEIATNHTGIQTDYKFDMPSSPPTPSLEQAYDELSVKYDQLQRGHTKILKKNEFLQNQCTAVKEAHDILIAKYRKDKLKWKAWTEHDQARRELTKKRMQEDSNRRRTTSPINKVFNTPALTSSPPRPPALSPDNSPIKSIVRETPLPVEKSVFDDEPVKKGGLFSGLQPSKVASFPKELDEMPDVNRKTPAVEQIDEAPSEASSIPETMEQDQPQLPTDIRQMVPLSRTTTGDSDITPSDATTSDTGDDNEITPKAKPPATAHRQEQMFPPPKIEQKSPASSREGTSWSKPVVIKSEPQSSQNDPGYLIPTQDSLDLDDVAPDQERELPRKRRKLDDQSDGVVIRQEEPEEDDMLLDEQDDHPVLPAVHFLDPDILPPPRRPSDMLKTPARKTPIAAPRKSPQTSTTRRGPVATSTPAKRSKRSHSKALVHVLEDGTDGDKAVNLNKGVPDIRTKTRLDDLLSTPMPRSPSLRAIGKEGVNAPPKKRDVFTTPVNPAATGKRQADTDPLPPRENTADAARVAQTKEREPAERIVINPAANDGLNYAFHEVVRDKEKRKCLPGCTRACCKQVGKFVETAGLPLVEKRGPRWRSSSPAGPSQDELEEQRFIQLYGRHREAFPRRKTPPFFWESEMLDTQQLKKQHEEADRMEKEKEEMRRKEAQKPGGRFMFKR